MTDLGRIIKYKIVNDRWIYSGPILLAHIVFFVVQGLERDAAYSDDSQVRYTIAKIRDYSRTGGTKWFNCYYFDGERYTPTILGLSSTRNANDFLNKYVWVKYSLKDPNFSDVMDISVYPAMVDSIPVPLGGITEKEFYRITKFNY